MNSDRINRAIELERIDVRFDTNVKAIKEDQVILSTDIEGENIRLINDLVYIFVGGELPTQFLQKVGIHITKKFGEAILKH